MLTPAQIRNIDALNIALIAASALCAVFWPFETFLLAYAVLGPLHYLTEISWLHDRRYFLPQRRDALPILIFGLVLVLFIGSAAAANKSMLRLALENTVLFSIFAAASVLGLWPSWRKRLIALALLVPACWGLARLAPFANSLSGYLLTVIHVYLFTGLFMLLGWLRNRSRSSAGALTAFVVFPIVCLLLPAGISVAPSAWAETSYIGTLSAINSLILGDLGFDMRGGEILRHPTSVLVTRLLAFAYLYHYLNWFSKIDLIGWGRISPARTAAIAALWIGAVALYFHNYLIGFAFLFILSFMHVVLEFPLNHQSMREIYARVASKAV